MANEAMTRPAVRAWFVDVGRGDCTIVIDNASKEALMIDCPSGSVNLAQQILTREGAALHTCIVTHWDADHYAGIARLAAALPVSRVHYNHDTLFEDGPGGSPTFAIVGALKRFLAVKNAHEVLRPAEAGEAGAVGKIRWRLLAPTHHEVTKAYVAKRRNIASAVVDVVLPSARVLVGGDAVGSTWRRLLDEFHLEADVLRGPHHGADLEGDTEGSIRSQVLGAVKPRYVVISAGARNTFGHPSRHIVQNAAAGATVLCTQVSAGCFGFLMKRDRALPEARAIVKDLVNPRCAGTVCLSSFSDHYVISPSSADLDLRIAGWPAPMCRRGSATVVANTVLDVAITSADPAV